jgi:hypothetical protein
MRPALSSQLVTSMSAADRERRVAWSLHYVGPVALGKNESSNLTASSMLEILPEVSRSLTSCHCSTASRYRLSCSLAGWEHQA